MKKVTKSIRTKQQNQNTDRASTKRLDGTASTMHSTLTLLASSAADVMACGIFGGAGNKTTSASDFCCQSGKCSTTQI